MKRKIQNVMVTGGAGFIGSNFIHDMFGDPSFDGRIVNVDKLTYAGNLENLAGIDEKFGGRRYFFEKADIQDYGAVKAILGRYDIDTVVHFAAESHVDRSIHGPAEFILANIMGTFNLLECVREAWRDRGDVLFHHVSTDEVYGSLDDGGYFFETTPYDPKSPYSASKASSDHLVRAYHHTYGLPVTLSNYSNNYGPYQFPEKLIPLMILNMKNGKPLPVYGDGKNVRDWIYVSDHNRALRLIVTGGQTGETYNIGGENEWENIRLIHALCEKMAEATGEDAGRFRGLITYVKDRAGHDRRYAINCDKLKNDLGWRRVVDFDEGLARTVRWYLDNETWLNHILDGSYQNWIHLNYGGR
ncbi:MAG: dTDP-glucose 4,6-dehydratase [Syntrophales bacterium]